MSQERLDKLITSQGTLSRLEAKKLIKSNLVRVNGAIIKKPEEKFDAEKVKIEINGKLIEFRRYVYIMLNKPKGIVSASRGKNQETVIDLVPDKLFRDGLFPAGRLDSDTTGFVLITDDGDFAHQILSPKSHVKKTYVATLAEPISEEKVEMLESGIKLADGTECMSAEIEMIDTETQRVVQIKICEGKYHQIKRMFAAVGNKVTELKRVAMGDLQLDTNLELGKCREITKEELKLVRNFTKNL
ncbi:MAG: pseudouridine synthase [Oscillospiraceae bacterium]